MVEIQYAVMSPFLSDRFLHIISKEEFEELERSYYFILDYMTFDENFLQCIYAFQEFEEFILKSAVHHYLFPISEYDFAQDTRVRANIKVLSFLNAVTSFRDQFPTFKKVPTLRGLRAHFDSEWMNQRETSLAFSFFERLRNFAQHQTQPVSSTTTGGRWDDRHEIIESHASVFVEVNEVCKNRKISMPEATRYKNEFGMKADISLIFRETIARLSFIVESIRIYTDKIFNESHSSLRRIIAVAKTKSNDFFAGDIFAIIEGKAEKKFEIFEEFIIRSKRLHDNFLIKNHERHVVSNRAFGHKKK